VSQYLFGVKKWIKITILSLLTLIAIAVLGELVYLQSSTAKEVFILPQGFKGIVLIAYDQENGLDDVVSGGKLIYKIPQNGVIRLKRKTASLLTQSWYYFEDKNGKKTEFFYCFDPSDMKKNADKVYAFGRSNGGYENVTGKVTMTTFLVGTEKDSDSLSRKLEKFNPLELLKTSN
jgi:hypothetical protein